MKQIHQDSVEGPGEEKHQQHEFSFNKTTSQPDSDQTAHIQRKHLELPIQ